VSKESNSRISLAGYDFLGENGSDGIRYAWKYGRSQYLLESAAFVHRSKGKEELISGYTTSVSLGCVLRSMGYQCKFCRTGNVIPFIDLLSAKDIAKQNIFMVLADMNCASNSYLRDSKREFAYMGQGEPGFSYTQVRLAIKITDLVLDKLGQNIHRHIIATAGVPEMIYAYKTDIISNYYDSRVTLHFSLHLTKDRKTIMPIDEKYSYFEVLNAINGVEYVTGEKPCIGIMLFSNFAPKNADYSYSNDLSNVESILKELDPSKVRLSFCEYNNADDIGTSSDISDIQAQEILSFAHEKGFDAKLFSSFGKEKLSACGMLGGKQPELQISKKWENLAMEADALVSDAITCLAGIE